ncbi:RHS repeat domain-containing protein [Pseudomonas sp. Leaf127]|uniref:RHS repeat domain-containing protein n=1 Tax=Pseudomonas sp. Leaf127 TaxID=1736267 RepID=UPI0009E7DE8E|nr:RHS repeat-associated core domain-containing protein [Pseudomonas sp. Leaf127]
MTTSTSVHSNAFNFMSFLSNGVDPRTGQYTVSISLPEVKANALRGPGLPLVLSYNPLNTVDSGLGLGWSLQLSQYARDKSIISLSSGESFKITGTQGADRLVMKEQKIDSFHLYKQDSPEQYRVMHKSGLVEILEPQGSAFAVPKTIHAPEGHKLTLEYVVFDNQWPLLKVIKDQAGEELLSIERASNEVVLLLGPTAGPDGGPLARFSMTLDGDTTVKRITLPTDNLASWRFEYDPIYGKHPRIVSVETPTGAHERLYYEDSGHPFPGSTGRDNLPRVTRHVIEPGFAQPPLDVSYTYSPENFLGAGLSIGWDEDGLDNLYKYVGSYAYTSTESQVVDSVSRAITRTFNQFHLLTQEHTEQGNAVKDIETRYGLLAGKPFYEQPSDCQLPKEVDTRWSLKNDATLQRTEKVISAYDAYGNLTREQQANGVTETRTWYPADGSQDGCPADPEGFVRQLKELTVTPAAGEGCAPVLRTRYRYVALPALDGSGLADWLTQDSETLLQVNGSAEQTLQSTTFSYINAPAVALLHGQLEQQTLTLNGLDTSTHYAYSVEDSPAFAQSVLHTVQTLSGFDGQQKVITLEHSLLNGEPLLNRDDNDVEIRYQYDVLRRVTRETVAPGTAFEALRQYTYTLCANAGEQAEQTVIDVKQVKTTSRFDGLNRVVFEARDDADTLGRASEPRQIYAAEYDAWGQLVEETEFDWLDDRQLALTRRLAYDDWGQSFSETGPDGVKTVEQTDPIGTDQSLGPIQCSWREGSDGSLGGKTETWFNLFEKPTRIERKDAAGTPVSLETVTYDGLGRTHEETQIVDGVARITRFGYDAFDRLLDNTLADGSIVSRTYAAHSTEDLPVSIRVQDGVKQSLLGEQVFDGLDRRTRAITGGREQVFTYLPGQRQPESVTTASGQVIGYEYDLQLSEEPRLRHLPGNVAALYEYDEHNARLISCQEQGESLSREYFSTGELKSETRQSGDGVAYQMFYRYSRLGRLLTYTDVLGQQQLNVYDTQGRLDNTTLVTTTAHFTYDVFGRLMKTETADSASGQYLHTELEYDDFDREKRRTFNLNGVVQSLEQHWNEADEVRQRTLMQGADTLRKELYQYDKRGRLKRYDCAGSQPPVDPYGNVIVNQTFTFDGLDNFKNVLTRFAEGSNMATYTYSVDDPAQLVHIKNQGANYPQEIALTYDADGNLTQDEAERTLTYDALNRLTSVSGPGGGGGYRYDPLDTLSGQDDDQRFYCGGQLTTRVSDAGQVSYLRGAEQLLAEHGSDEPQLLATDSNNSVLGQLDSDGVDGHRYTAYGHSVPKPEGSVGYNGEFTEPATRWQLLGNGYRAYNPVLMRFHSPDNLSPFEEGGVNAYMYCGGDPVNQVDPSGHSPWGGFIRLFRKVKTVGAINPPLPKKLAEGGDTARLSKLTSDDVGSLQRLENFKRTAYENETTLYNKAVNRIGMTDADIQPYQQRVAAAMDEFQRVESARKYASNNVGKQRITPQSRHALSEDLNWHEAQLAETKRQAQLVYQRGRQANYQRQVGDFETRRNAYLTTAKNKDVRAQEKYK